MRAQPRRSDPNPARQFQARIKPLNQPTQTMSQKITSKNLTYDTALPPFLARLRGQQAAARNGGPDPILAANRRPGQKRSASEEAEDAPVVVDESGNVVELRDGLLSLDGEDEKDAKEGEEGRKGGEEGEEGKDSAGSSSNREREKEKEKVAGIGASRKRKAGRVIGEKRHSGSDSDDNDGKSRKAKRDRDDAARVAKASADVRRLVDGDKKGEGNRDKHAPANVRATDDKKPAAGSQQQQQKTAIKGAKKKAAKKIKLSFGDEGE